MRFSCEFDSNEIDVSKPQEEKHDDSSISTLLGITIAQSDESENALDSIRINREFDSNEIDKNSLHGEKHDDPRISISDGIVM
jgi:hypothetical protein